MFALPSKMDHPNRSSHVVASNFGEHFRINLQLGDEDGERACDHCRTRENNHASVAVIKHQ